MKHFIFIFLLCLLTGIDASIAQQTYSDPKQTNETGKDVLADAPWHLKKTDAQGNPKGIPLHVFIKDADGLGSNAELIYINIYIKNATDTAFGDPITFETYTDSAFLSLFSSKSVADADFDIQSFDASLPAKDSNYTIQFTANDCVWPDECQYVDITHNLWYFTMTIPPEKLAGFDDIIDIHVYFSLNWDTDDESFLRVFRYDDAFPALPGWYRGDAHYHTMYTNNTAEFGPPLSSTKETAKSIGIDWITTTNHSCDYDEYGTDMYSNWNREKSEIQALNASDTSMLFIQSMEASVQNSADNCVHMLCYPSSSSPYALPYIGDGDGDVTGTSLTIDDLLDSLNNHSGFAYASHPFAGGDVLSVLVDGGIWNINDGDFFANGEPLPGNDVVICNDLSNTSDIYSANTGQELYKPGIIGGEIWNYRNEMTTTDEAFNPWNVTYDSGISPFVLYDTTDTYAHYNRFLQGLEVTKFLNKKGLILKNSNTNLLNYKFYINAGSDAHGDFNYSNTSFVFGVSGDISDAVIGSPSTLVYCPSGMGNTGSNVLASLENGHVIISDGPLVSIGISTDGDDSSQEYIIGDEALPNTYDYVNAKLNIDLITTNEFGNFNKLKIIAGTQNGEYILSLPVDSSALANSLVYNFDSLLQQILAGDSIQDFEYFYLRAELRTYKNYNTLSSVYRRVSEKFNCYTNPIWIRKPDMSTVSVNETGTGSCRVYPNPFDNSIQIKIENSDATGIKAELYNVFGALAGSLNTENIEGTFEQMFSTENLADGFYLMKISSGEKSYHFKLMKVSHDH